MSVKKRICKEDEAKKEVQVGDTQMVTGYRCLSGQKTAAHRSDLSTTGLQLSGMGQQKSLMFWMLLRKLVFQPAQSGSPALNYLQLY